MENSKIWFYRFGEGFVPNKSFYSFKQIEGFVGRKKKDLSCKHTDKLITL